MWSVTNGYLRPAMRKLYWQRCVVVVVVGVLSQHLLIARAISWIGPYSLPALRVLLAYNTFARQWLFVPLLPLASRICFLFRSLFVCLEVQKLRIFWRKWLTDRQTDRQAYRQTDWMIVWQTDRRTDRQTDRQTDGQTDRQTDKQNNQLNILSNIKIKL